MKTKTLLITIIVLSVLGIVTSGYLYSIYNQDDTGICDINDKFSCSSVKNSKFSSMFGMSVPILGIAGYSFLFIGTLLLIIKPRPINKILKKKYMFFVALVGLLFSLYLTYAEFFIIKAFCVFCIASQVIILAITVLYYFSLRKN